MALPGFKGTTYEVLTGDGARWIIAHIFRVEKEARDLANQLLASGRHPMVRITARRDGWVTERVIFQENGQLTAKAIKPVPVATAPVCKTPRDCLRHEARLAVGRVGRAYLDERGITAAEFLVSPGDLVAVERRDNFFITGVHLLAKAQADEAGQTPSDRAEILFELHEKLRKQTRDLSDDDIDALRAAVAERGLAALPMGAPEEPPTLLVLSCLARILAEGGSWPGRLAKLIDLLDGNGAAAARALVDQIIAEMLDAPQALSEILGGLREGMEACSTLSALASGSNRLPKYASEAAHRLHSLMGRSPLPVTQRILMERLARVLGSVRPLTQEGGEAERQAFTALVPTLLDPAGILGGSATAEALTLRSKMALGQHEDLAMSAAIERLLEIFPTRAVRLGYLLDLMPTPTGQKNDKTIRHALAELIAQLRSVRHLMPDGTPAEVLAAAIHALRARLAMETLPEEVRGALSSSIDTLLRGGRPAVPEAIAVADPAAPRRVDAGKILFREGDDSREAYLITAGMVEIYRERDGREEIIATLGRGEVFGDLSLIDNVPRAASARTRPGTSLVVLTPDELRKRLGVLEAIDRPLKLVIDGMMRRLQGQDRGPV